jgi:hypothetical protein
MDKPDMNLSTVDLSTVFPAAEGVRLDEGGRLRFARQVLLGLALICCGVFVPAPGHLGDLVLRPQQLDQVTHCASGPLRRAKRPGTAGPRRAEKPAHVFFRLQFNHSRDKADRHV